MSDRDESSPGDVDTLQSPDRQPDDRELARLFLSTDEGALLPAHLQRELEQSDTGGSLRRLVAAEVRRRQGEVIECCEALAAVPHEQLRNHPHLAQFKADIVMRCVGDSQRAAGLGDWASAVRINTILLHTAAEIQEPVTELLLVHLFLLNDVAACAEFAAVALKWPILGDRLTILLAEYYRRIGNRAEVARLLASVATVQFQDPSYLAWHARLKLALATYLYAARDTTDKLTAAIGAAEVACACADHIRTVAAVDEMNLLVMRLAFHRVYDLPDPYETIGRAMMLLAEHGDDDMAASGAAYFSATRDHVRFQRVLDIAERRPALWTNPHFAKSVSRFAQAIGDARLDERICRSADEIIARIGTSRSRRAGLRAAEIRARAGSLGVLPRTQAEIRLPAPTLPPVRRFSLLRQRQHIFVGLFGQLRHEAEALPALRCFIEKEVARITGGARVRLHFGMAVWDETGQRPILSVDGNHGGANVLFARLPPDLAALATRNGATSLDAFGSRFPHTLALAVELARQTAMVDRGLVERHFGTVGHLDINRKAPFQPEIARLMALFFVRAEAHPDFRNQLMMWERVAQFRTQIEALERTERTPISGGMFVRVDLMFGKATISDVLAAACKEQSDCRLWVDHDPAADFIEGVGDRFFIGGRRALLTVASLWPCICALAERIDGSHALYRERLASHMLICSFLFEQGITVQPVGSEIMPFTIHRGTLSWQALLGALEQDVATLGDQPLGHELAALLAAARPMAAA